MKELAERVAAAALRHGAWIAAAESCTGGWLGQALTAVPGSSAWFDRGFITYSNAAKQEMLGVRAGTLSAHGAVSEETAREMALGALERSRATVAVAITGVAGPAGGSAEKPVGTVCFAWARKAGQVQAKITPKSPAASETRHFAGDREAVRRQSVEHALTLLSQALDEG